MNKYLIVLAILFPVTGWSQIRPRLAMAVSVNAVRTYHVNTTKVIGFTTLFASAFTDGFLSRYEFGGRTFFEHHFGVRPTSYFGSQSWRSIYRGGDPGLGPRSRLHYIVGAQDFWHHADKFRSHGRFVAGATIALSGNPRFSDYIIDAVLGLGFSAGGKFLGDRVAMIK